MSTRYLFEKWSDNITDNPRIVNVTGDLTLTAIFRKEVNGVVVYKPSEVKILVHSAISTGLTASPSEIGTVASPAEIGTVVQILTILIEVATGNPITGKTLHFYYPDGTEQGTGKVTDLNGQATFNYTVRAEDDGLELSIQYLGD